jgi:phosphatidate phosphatase APP1
MVFLVLTRHAIADLSDLPTGNATAVWVNPGVLTNEELAQMQASGINVNVLPRVLDHTKPGAIQRQVEEIRRSHSATIWAEQPVALPESPQPVEAPPTEGAPVAVPSPSSSGKTRSVSGWTLRQLKRFSASDGPARIFPYMGFGTAERFVLQGRVMMDKGFRPPSKTRSAWTNFFELYKRIDSRDVPGATIVAQFRDVEQQGVTDTNGYFRFEFNLSEPLETSGWHELQLRLVNPPMRGGSSTVPAQVLVPSSRARFGVISDIDDTVLWSNVTNKLKMLKMLAVTNAHTRKPFKGVTAFYCALRNGLSGNDDNPLFYVSSSPWHLYTPLVDFFQAQGIPLGPLMLKELGVKHLFGRDRHHGHKLTKIEKILQTYPDLPFILIGDSGQQDPEIYREVVHRHPQRIRAIYIRNVNPDPTRIEAIDQLIEEVRPTGTQLLLVPDSESAAAHAAAEGLINPLGMQRVRSDKQDDNRLL